MKHEIIAEQLFNHIIQSIADGHLTLEDAQHALDLALEQQEMDPTFALHIALEAQSQIEQIFKSAAAK